MSKELSEQQISAGGRWLFDQSADACGVNGDDNWKVYGSEYIEEFRGAYSAAVSVEPATVNKAAEEVELPLEHYEFDGKWLYDADQVRQAIAADRASRQVANKAEVEPYGYFRKNGKLFEKLRGRPNEHTLSSGWFPLYATPPATTGASTAAFEDALRYGTGIMQINPDISVEHVPYENVVSASTVLTDERIDVLWREAVNFNEQGSKAETSRRFARAVAREVAAQAGQVVVPGWKLVPAEPTEAMVHAAEDLPAPRMFAKVYRAMIGAAPSPAKESK